MAKRSTSTDSNGEPDPAATQQPMPEGAKLGPWTPPDTDQEFVFTGRDSLPDWADLNWLGFDRGDVALVVPTGDVTRTEGPWTSTHAHKGDRVKYIAAQKRFVVEIADPSQQGFPHATAGAEYEPGKEPA